MKQVDTGVALSAARIQRLKSEIAQLEAKISSSSGMNKLLDTLILELGLKNDKALAKFFGDNPTAISKMRHGAKALNPHFILAVHEKAGMAVARIRELAK